MEFEDLSPELQEKVQNATTAEEIYEIAKEAGHKLTDEELEAIGDMSGGWCKKKIRKILNCRFNAQW